MIYSDLIDRHYLNTSINLILTTERTTALSGHSNISVATFKIFLFSSFYVAGVFFPFGLLFNLLLLLVFGFSKHHTKQTTRLFYFWIAYGELGTVLFKDAFYFWGCLGVPFITEGKNPLGPLNSMGKFGKDTFPWMCGLQVFLWYSHELFANYTFLVFELDNVFVIYQPLKTPHLFTKRTCLITVR